MLINRVVYVVIAYLWCASCYPMQSDPLGKGKAPAPVNAIALSRATSSQAGPASGVSAENPRYEEYLQGMLQNTGLTDDQRFKVETELAKEESLRQFNSLDAMRSLTEDTVDVPAGARGNIFKRINFLASAKDVQGLKTLACSKCLNDVEQECADERLAVLLSLEPSVDEKMGSLVSCLEEPVVRGQELQNGFSESLEQPGVQEQHTSNNELDRAIKACESAGDAKELTALSNVLKSYFLACQEAIARINQRREA